MKYKWYITEEFDSNHILHVQRSDGAIAEVWWGIVPPTDEELAKLNYHIIKKEGTTMENTVKRITKAQKYEDIIALLSGNPAKFIDADGAVEFCKSEIALLAKKNSSDNKKPTATQEANAKYKALIMEFLAVQDAGKTCTEIAKGVPELGDFNNQKVAALMRQLVEAGQAHKATVKGKSVFTVA